MYAKFEMLNTFEKFSLLRNEVPNPHAIAVRQLSEKVYFCAKLKIMYGWLQKKSFLLLNGSVVYQKHYICDPEYELTYFFV